MIILLVIVVVIAMLYKPRTITGGMTINSSRANPLVFISMPKPVKLKFPGWNVIPANIHGAKIHENTINKKISDSLRKKPTIVSGEPRDDIVYEKPDLHIHLTPVLWDMTNPMDLAQKKSILEQKGIDFDKYWDSLGHMDIDVLIQSSDEIKAYLKELQTIRAGLVVLS